MDTELIVTLWPSFPHFQQFANDPRLQGIRLNSAQINCPELETELARLELMKPAVPLFFDIKGRQLRVTEVLLNDQYLDLRLNHPIQVQTPTPVLLKGGQDHALLERLEEGGQRLIFRGGPKHMVYPGESLCIRHPTLQVGGDLFTEVELEKIQRVRTAGFTRYFLSYAETQRDVDEFRSLVGKDAEIWLKIENKRGIDFVAKSFRKQPGLTLTAARGDLYLEIDRPHQMANVLRLIIDRDPEACVASRMLLSVVTEPVPSCTDFLEIEWLRDIGYKRMMLCDDICLKEDWLNTAVNAFDAFRTDYTGPSIRNEPLPSPPARRWKWWPTFSSS